MLLLLLLRKLELALCCSLEGRMKPSQVWAPLQVNPEVNMSSFELQWPEGGHTVLLLQLRDDEVW